MLKTVTSFRIFIFLLCLTSVSLSAQKPLSYTKPVFGKGIGFASADSSFTLALSGRIQSMAEVRHELNTEQTLADFFVRRCRLNVQGTAYSPKLTYRIQIGFAQRDITADNSAAQNNLILRDAMLFYSPYKWLRIGFGQTKLPGNKQRQVSSANLQLVERSIVNNNFTLDRDKGIWLYGSFNMGSQVIRPILAISSGEGRINSDRNGELCYSGRLEWYPFGNFTNNGELIESDQEKEKKPKLVIAGVYSYNSANSRAMGQLGEYLYNGQYSNVTYYGGDLMFKYKGFSFEAELYTRESNTGIIINKKDSTQRNFVMAGQGMMLQAGMFVSPRNEIAVRYGKITPASAISSLAMVQEEYVLGFSRYFQKHSLKIQTDCSYFKNGSRESLVYRLSSVITF